MHSENLDVNLALLEVYAKGTSWEYILLLIDNHSSYYAKEFL